MATFHFHLHECGIIVEDCEGRQVPDLALARTLAIAEARSVMSEEVALGRLCLACCIVIADDSGRELDRVLFRDALAITGI